MKLKFGMDDYLNVYNKHTKFHQNPRGQPKFLVAFTWNDPPVCSTKHVFVNYYNKGSQSTSVAL